MEENEIGSILINAAVEIHSNLGPGLLESVYEIILCKKLEKSGLAIKKQVKVPLQYEGLSFRESFRADLIIENRVIAEIKSVERTQKVHAKQLLTYLRLTNLRLGFLLNFGAPLMRDGITRMVNNL